MIDNSKQSSYKLFREQKQKQELAPTHLQIPTRARELGIQKITVQGNRGEHIVTIEYTGKNSELRWYTSLDENLERIERAMKIIGFSLEARSWIIVIVQLELEKEISN